MIIVFSHHNEIYISGMDIYGITILIVEVWGDNNIRLNKKMQLCYSLRTVSLPHRNPSTYLHYKMGSCLFYIRYLWLHTNVQFVLLYSIIYVDCDYVMSMKRRMRWGRRWGKRKMRRG